MQNTIVSVKRTDNNDGGIRVPPRIVIIGDVTLLLICERSKKVCKPFAVNFEKKGRAFVQNEIPFNPFSLPSYDQLAFYHELDTRRNALFMRLHLE